MVRCTLVAGKPGSRKKDSKPRLNLLQQPCPIVDYFFFLLADGRSCIRHSFACPGLGIKCDAYPGRLNQVSVMINREGVFYGQCSELCGILHSSMPIVIESVSIDKFVSWLQEQ